MSSRVVEKEIKIWILSSKVAGEIDQTTLMPKRNKVASTRSLALVIQTSQVPEALAIEQSFPK
jgi:hypothetical protein